LDSGTRAAAGSFRDVPGTVTNQALAVEWPHGSGSLRVVGEVDLGSHSLWGEVLTALPDDDTPVRLDLSGLSFVDVQGAAALMEAARRRVSTTRITLLRPPPSLRRTLELFWSSELSNIVIEDEEAG